MARGTQLKNLIYMLRAETGQSVLVSAGIDNKPALAQMLNRVQQGVIPNGSAERT